MAFGQALMLVAALVPQESGCDFHVVFGRSEPPSEYLQIVDLYRSGDRAEAIRRSADVDRGAPAEMIERLHDIRSMPPGTTTGGFPPDDDCLLAASMMEAELGLSLAAESRWNDADFHLDSAWKVSVEIQSTRLRDRFQRDFPLAAGLFLHERIFLAAPDEAFPRADRFLQEAARRYPQDPEILLAQGALLEWSGSLPEGGPAHLKQAQELYAQCLRIVPHDREALLRHGWVLQKLGRDAEAEASLRRLLPLRAEDNLIYRSRMVLGSLAERAGRLDQAVDHCREATRVVASWQVAYLACPT